MTSLEAVARQFRALKWGCLRCAMRLLPHQLFPLEQLLHAYLGASLASKALLRLDGEGPLYHEEEMEVKEGHELELSSYCEGQFDAVLAGSSADFTQLERLLKPGGVLFLRTDPEQTVALAAAATAAHLTVRSRPGKLPLSTRARPPLMILQKL